MALGYLFILFIVLIVLEIIGLTGLFLIKNPKVNTIVFTFLALLTLLISYMGATALPSNYIFQQIVAWSWGVLAILALGMKFFSTKYTKHAKYLLAFCSAAALLDLLIM